MMEQNLKGQNSVLVVLGLGSNRSYNGLDCIQLLDKACECLSKTLSLFIKSSIYLTKPMYLQNQSDFYNMVVAGYYEKTPDELLIDIHQIENEYGRNRENEIRNGPRSLDIDIEIFGSSSICTKDLVIPHPRITERAFVLVPLLEILPNCADVISGRLYKSFLDDISQASIKEVQKWNRKL